jgi:hypothetical protein
MYKLKSHILPIIWDKAMVIPDKAWSGFEIIAPLLGAVVACRLTDFLLVREDMPTLAIIGAYAISVRVVAYFFWDCVAGLYFDIWAVKQSFQKVASHRQGSAIHRLWVEALRENFNLIYPDGKISLENMSAPMNYFRDRVGAISN